MIDWQIITPTWELITAIAAVCATLGCVLGYYCGSKLYDERLR